jgi:hypothetical protein
MVKSPKHTDGEGVDADVDEDPSAFRQLFRFAIYRWLPDWGGLSKWFALTLALVRGVCCVRVPWLKGQWVDVDQSWAEDESFTFWLINILVIAFYTI